MHNLRKFEPARPTSHKDGRVFHHPQTGRLLVKAYAVSKWNTDPDYRQALIDGKEPVYPNDYPIFLYKEEKIDWDNLLDGFLQNDLLVHTFRAVFQGPSAIEGHGPSTKSTKKGNTELNNMTEVTLPSIAYVASLVYFALSSQTNFSAGGEDGCFDYNAFYQAIIDLCSLPVAQAKRISLLNWWTRKVFPHKYSTTGALGSSLHAMMMTQLGEGN